MRDFVSLDSFLKLVARWMTRDKSLWRKLLAVATVLLLVVNCVMTLGFLYISRLNYPGGQALQQFHQLEEATNQGLSCSATVFWEIFLSLLLFVVFSLIKHQQSNQSNQMI